MKNALTFDIEDYLQVSAFSEHVDITHWGEMPSRVEANTLKILDLLCVYLHPWELDSEQPRTAVGLAARARHYLGLQSAASKFRRRQRDFDFQSVGAAIEETPMEPYLPWCNTPSDSVGSWRR